jgi:hypothetical protein
MKYVTWNGETFKWNFTKYHNRKKHSNKSKLHQICREILAERYVHYSIYEEVTLPGINLYADFYITNNLIVEVHGRQHYEYVPHFHKSQGGFLKAKKRDKDKMNWATENGLLYIALPFDKIDEWTNILP